MVSLPMAVFPSPECRYIRYPSIQCDSSGFAMKVRPSMNTQESLRGSFGKRKYQSAYLNLKKSP